MTKLEHLIAAQQFDRPILEEFFGTTDEMVEIQRKGGSDFLRRKGMAALFYEPSTRTRFSFQRAMQLLGGDTIFTESAEHFSSVVKGETLEDTIMVVGGFVDVIVLRHKEEGAAMRAAEISPVPVINAGDGPGQHPTQALLDLYTIRKELGRIDGLSYALVGDLLNARTVRSLAYLLAKFSDVRLTFVFGKGLGVHKDILDYLTRHNVRYELSHNLAEVASEVNVVYMTRFQQERVSGDAAEAWAAYETTNLTDEIVRRMKPDSIIMHPLPRNREIPRSVDADKRRAVYFRQSWYGVSVRMTTLAMTVAA